MYSDVRNVDICVHVKSKLRDKCALPIILGRYQRKFKHCQINKPFRLM